MRRGDERAVTVQVGAVLLLGILLTALAIYQVNVVPAENQEVEFNHNQQVQGELQDLRNSIQNVGTNGGSQSTSITLGTQYPTRSFTVNPTNPTGSLETSGVQTVSIEGANVDDSQYDGTPSELLDDGFNTTTVGYTPNYNEYSDPPATRIEHGFAYNQFQASENGLTSQPLVDGDQISLVLVDGELSEFSGSTVSLDTTIESGPTDPIEIEISNGELEVPTQAPDAWNETLEDESNATPDAFSDGTLTVDLDDGSYELTATCVAIDRGGDNCEDLDISEVSGGEPTTGSVLDGPAVEDLGLKDEDEEIIQDGEEVEQGDPITINPANFSNLGIPDDERGGVPINSAYWNVTEEGDTSGTPVKSGEFDTDDPDTEELDGVIMNFSNSFDIDDAFDTDESYVVNAWATDTRGIETNSSEREPTEAFTVIEDQEGNGDNGDDDPANFQVEITDTNSPVSEGETLNVTAEITNTGEETDTQSIELTLDPESDNQDNPVADTEITLAGDDDSSIVELEWETSEGDAGEYEATVSSDDDEESRQITVEDGESGGPSAVDGTIELENEQGDRAVFFDIKVENSELTGFDVETRGNLEQGAFEDGGSEFGGTTSENLPTQLDGEVNIELRAFDSDFGVGGGVDRSFVDPNSDDADIIATFEFEGEEDLVVGISIED